jgi:hypothetical protein
MESAISKRKREMGWVRKSEPAICSSCKYFVWHLDKYGQKKDIHCHIGNFKTWATSVCDKWEKK